MEHLVASQAGLAAKVADLTRRLAGGARAVLDVECPVCQAPPGAGCVTRLEPPLSGSHTERLAAAVTGVGTRDHHRQRSVHISTVVPLNELLGAAYRERAHLAAWLAALHPSVVAPAPADVGDGWHVLFLRAGGWQFCWHISPGDLSLFDHVLRVPDSDPRAQWDGHTFEQKYRRIRTHTAVLRTPGSNADDGVDT
ncbi:hypothetical protein PV342_12910 [Streptomyces sp. PA03-3a]|nr:hypothetical protein [Streptomyces sp. PA03-3a]